MLLAVGSAVGAATTARRAMTKPPAAPGKIMPPPVEVLVLRRAVAAGETVAAADLRWQPWPAAALPAAAIHRRPGSAAPEFQPGVARAPLIEGEPVADAKLIRAGQGSAFAALIAPGRRGVAVPVREESAAGGLIQPNDRVDVMWTRGAAERNAARPATRTLLRGVKVLAIGHSMQMREKSADTRTATLELTPDQARIVASARSAGEISLALIPTSDIAGLGDGAIDRRSGRRAAAGGGRIEIWPAIRRAGTGRGTAMKSTLSTLTIVLGRIIALVVPFMMAAPPAHAGDPALTEIRASLADRAETQRAVTVGLNKSTLIELPDDVREVIISDPDVVEAVVRSTRRVHLLGRKIGQASASFVGRGGRQLLTLDVSVERDLSQVTALIKRLMPSADVRLEAINDNIVVMGRVGSPLDSTRIADIAGRFVSNRDQVLNMLDVEAKEQVLLRVKVVEMNRSVIQRLGVDIRQALATNSVTVVKMAEAAFPLTGAAAAALPYLPVTGTLDGPGAGSTAALGWRNGKLQVDAILQALERNGLARTLAEPNLTSVSGETAKFLAGGEYPVPVGSDSNGTTISFKPFGVGLSFTPVVLSEGRISLQIATEVSELTNEGAVTVNQIAIPALRVRRASSTLELPSGGSLVMAGLISSQTRRNVDGLPGLQIAAGDRRAVPQRGVHPVRNRAGRHCHADAGSPRRCPGAGDARRRRRRKPTLAAQSAADGPGDTGFGFIVE